MPLEDEGVCTPHLGELDVPEATPDPGFTCIDLTSFCRFDELGLEATGQRLEPGPVVLAYRIVEDDRLCRRCG